MSELNSVVFSPLMRMNEVKRYSGTRLQEEESLSHHITDVSMMSYIVAKRLISNNDSIDIGSLLEKCLIHDLDEIATGDIPRNTKYAIPGMKVQLDEVSGIAIKKFSDSLLGFDDLYYKWSDAKSGKEGYILQMVDMLCVVRKASIEVEVYNNLSCLKVVTELCTHLSKMKDKLYTSNLFNTESVLFLNSLLDESIDHIETLKHNYADICERYNITKHILEV